jgi:hypothetical protein
LLPFFVSGGKQKRKYSKALIKGKCCIDTHVNSRSI